MTDLTLRPQARRAHLVGRTKANSCAIGRHADWLPRSKTPIFATLFNRIVEHEGSAEKALQAMKISRSIPIRLKKGERISAYHGRAILEYYNKNVKGKQQ